MDQLFDIVLNSCDNTPQTVKTVGANFTVWIKYGKNGGGALIAVSNRVRVPLSEISQKL
jgi:hypothetical protein